MYYTDKMPAFHCWHSNFTFYLWGVKMADSYATIKEIAEKWNITPHKIQMLCIQSGIPGAVKFGRNWAAPDDMCCHQNSA